MGQNGTTAILLKIGKIYISIVKRIGSFLAFICGAVAIAAVLVLPIWYLAEHFNKIYTAIVLAGIAGFVIFLTIRNTVRKRKITDSAGGFRLIRFLWKLGAILLLIGWVYIILIVILRHMIIPAVFMIIAFLFAFGFFLYAKHKSDNPANS